MITRTLKIGAISAVSAIALTLSAAPAHAGDYLYMTGTTDPWGNTQNDAAMDLAFGAGNWDKTNGFNASAFGGTHAFVYLDGGDGISGEFDTFIGANLAALESFVTGGGHVFLNAARWTNPLLNTGFGTTLAGDQFSSAGALTAAGLAAGLDANGAGAAWTGNYFSHDVVGGVDTCYVTGTAGCVFGSKGAGLFVGGQTTANWQSAGGLQLRANELTLAATGATTGAVPEPSTWAMMLIGFGALGAAMRRKQHKTTVAVSYA
jgi:hypothetical protein